MTRQCEVFNGSTSEPPILKSPSPSVVHAGDVGTCTLLRSRAFCGVFLRALPFMVVCNVRAILRPRRTDGTAVGVLLRTL